MLALDSNTSQQELRVRGDYLGGAVGHRCAMGGTGSRAQAQPLDVVPLPLKLPSQDLTEKSYLLSNLNSS